MLSGQVSRFLVTARWMAAFAVLSAHAGGSFIRQGDIMTAPHWPGSYIWWFLTGFPHQAVIVFFVISGYLVGGNLIEKSRGTEPFLAKYFTDRIVRIYLVFVPVVLLGWGLDTIGRCLFNGSAVYNLPMFHYDLALLWTTLLNLQRTIVPMFGTNHALWSLSCEFWYYIVGALLLLPWTRVAPLTRSVGFACGGILAIVFSVFGPFFLFGGLIWIAGALVRLVSKPLIRSKGVALVIFFAVAAAVRVIVWSTFDVNPLWYQLGDVATALSFCNLLLSLQHAHSKNWTICNWRIHKPLSDFSYSLYACHVPIVIFTAVAADYALGSEWRAQAPTALHWMVAFLVIILNVCAAWLLSRVTEARTEETRLAVYRVVALLSRHYTETRTLRLLRASL
jgi:peptidoglycan/LPS O-acetylase OafA/YrhL